MSDRQEILKQIATKILELPQDHIPKVGIDGVDGAGKTYFAKELAQLLEMSGRPIICASVDSFHNPRSVRYRLGKDSPEGFFRDSYDYPQLQKVLLDPLSPGGSGQYRTAVFDHRTDTAVSAPEEQAVLGSILVVDGIFLHRSELRLYWDFSVFLDVGFDVSIPRIAQRGEGLPDPQAPENYRYVEGQRLYLRECEPKKHATIIVNNENLATPYIVV